MTVNEILTPVILQEFKKYENLGCQIKLKTTKSRRIKYSIICGIIALLGFVHPVYFAAVPVYIVLMLKTKNNIDLIISLAKKNPNKPIDQIVAEELKLPYNNYSAMNPSSTTVSCTVCPKCGFVMKLGAAFCGKCGNKL